MVILNVKKGDEALFLYDTKTSQDVDAATMEVCGPYRVRWAWSLFAQQGEGQHHSPLCQQMLVGALPSMSCSIHVFVIPTADKT